uniref:Uncharacterized protein n=1 Tax=Ditylenchus dipsaci TaxID=166011 RepID=A0A915ELY7_9BILA
MEMKHPTSETPTYTSNENMSNREVVEEYFARETDQNIVRLIKSLTDADRHCRMTLETLLADDFLNLVEEGNPSQSKAKLLGTSWPVSSLNMEVSMVCIRNSPVAVANLLTILSWGAAITDKKLISMMLWHTRMLPRSAIPPRNKEQICD